MADSVDCNYTTFCPHCENSLPPRTFRYHREKYYDEVNDVWKKDNDKSSDEEVFMETNLDYGNQYDSDDPSNTVHENEANIDQDALIYHEVWENTRAAEIDEDIVDNVQPILS